MPDNHSSDLSGRTGEAKTLSSLGVVYSDTGDLDAALEFLNQALPLLRQTGNKRGEADTLYNLSKVYKDTGQPQKAQESVNQALALDRAL